VTLQNPTLIGRQARTQEDNHEFENNLVKAAGFKADTSDMSNLVRSLSLKQIESIAKDAATTVDHTTARMRHSESDKKTTRNEAIRKTHPAGQWE
jgi:ribosomal protein L12E/L44/L45/RPP1/RPP2